MIVFKMPGPSAETLKYSGAAGAIKTSFAEGTFCMDRSNVVS